MKCLVIQPIISKYKNIHDYNYKLQEAVNLSEALELEVYGSYINNIREVNPATFLTKGFLRDLFEIILEQEISLIIINYTISPIQQRNLENYLKCKVLDRNGLIINIFSKRAKSKEGKLQVELAYLVYQKSRLVKAWSHLERQRGGGAFVGGPGEKQKELDKRMLGDKIESIKKQLSKVKQNREIQASSRRKYNYKVVALVGYTNAGKSTLFNKLTNAGVLAKDLLFATLDPTMRLINISNKDKVILLDTVGFISELPHNLIESFHSTLDEIKEATIILHIIDASHKHYKDQIASVKIVLSELGISDKDYESKVIEVYNKIDLLDYTTRKEVQDNVQENSKNTHVFISASLDININKIKDKIAEFLHKNLISMDLKVAYDDTTLLMFIYSNTIVVSSIDNNDYIKLQFLISQSSLERMGNLIHKITKKTV